MSSLVFLGSPQVSADCLRALAQAGHEIRLVVTEADKRRGRRGGLSPTPVKAAALELGLRTTEDLGDVAPAGAELGVVVAFGRLIRPNVLEQLPMVNVHFSLLPRWRGAAPVERAILAGDEYTGVCLMRVEAGLDTGGVYARATTAIGPDETASALRHRLGEIGTTLLIDRLQGGVATLGEPIPQQGEPTYAAKVSVDELRLDFSRPALELGRVVRVGRAWTSWRGSRLLVHEATTDPSPVDGQLPGTILGDRVATGSGWLVPLEVQPEGRKRQPFSEWARGARPGPGERLGNGDPSSPGSTVA